MLVTNGHRDLIADLETVAVRTHHWRQLGSATKNLPPGAIAYHTWESEFKTKYKAMYWYFQISAFTGLEPNHRRLPAKTLDSYERVAEGNLAGSPVQALADTGAQNFVSEDFVRAQGKCVDRKARRAIKLGDGSRILTLGSVRLSWTFTGVLESHEIDFDVLPSRFCQYPVTLGGKFLHASESLTTYAHRIIRRLRRGRIPRVLLQGGSQIHFQGSGGVVPVTALPDTASDLNLVSRDIARALEIAGHKVLKDQQHRPFVELPGGRIVQTEGVFCDVDFKFGEYLAKDRCMRDFYVLPGLPVDVILGDRFLSETDAFTKYSEYLVEEDGNQGADDPEGLYDGTFFNIKLVEQARSFLSKWRRRKNTNNPEDDALDAWCEEESQLLDQMQSAHENDTLRPEEKHTLLARLGERYRSHRRKKPRKSRLSSSGPGIILLPPEANADDPPMATVPAPGRPPSVP